MEPDSWVSEDRSVGGLAPFPFSKGPAADVRRNPDAHEAHEDARYDKHGESLFGRKGEGGNGELPDLELRRDERGECP